jgi:hypothetical protein
MRTSKVTHLILGVYVTLLSNWKFNLLTAKRQLFLEIYKYVRVGVINRKLQN